MSRTERVSKGLVVRQQEQSAQNVLPNKSVTLNKLSDEVRFGLIPVGAIIPIMSNMAGAFTPGASGTVIDGLMLCDGAAIPINQILSGNTPDLTNNRFLMGASTAGLTGGTNDSSHTHEYVHTHGLSNHQHGMQHEHITDSKLGTITLAHSHTVNSHNHSVAGHRHEFRIALGDRDYNAVGTGAAMGTLGQSGAFRYSTNQYQGGGASGSYNQTYNNAGGSSFGSVTRYVSTGDTSFQGDQATTSASPGTNSQLSNYNASHSHRTGGSIQLGGPPDITRPDTDVPDLNITDNQSTTTTGNPSINENRPNYMSCIYVIRVV